MGDVELKINVLIAEDEDMIRDKIRNNIDWAGNGFGQIYVAADGMEAKELYDRFQPELVITDIQMPEMNGIELTSYIKQINSNSRVIIITGHAEFNYAMESIRLNVFDYILKPFQSRNLLLKALRAKEEIEALRRESLERDYMQRKLLDHQQLLQEKLFRDLLNDCLQSEAEKQMVNSGLGQYKGRAFHVAAVHIDFSTDQSSDEELRMTNLMLHQWLESQVAQEQLPYLVVNHKLEQLVLIAFDSLSAIRAALEKWMQQAQNEVKVWLTVGIGSECLSLTLLHVSYQEACSAVSLSSMQGKGKVYTYLDLCHEHGAYSKQLQMLVDHKLYGHMKNGLFQEMKNDVEEIMGEIMKAGMDPQASVNVINHMLLLAYKVVNDLGFAASEIIAQTGFHGIAVGDFHDFASLREVVVRIFRTMTKQIQTKMDDRNVTLILAIKQHVEEHYHEHITLTSLAKQFNISSSYLSLLFREQTSYNFIDYLTTIRIQKAKKLLGESDLRVYEIAERVGYRDAFYFSNAFKRNVGISPTEYRENIPVEEH